jgi:antitoxin ParD1/3/4
MTKVEKMEIFLAPETAAAVEEAVASEEYASASDVIADALRAWQVNRAGEGLDVEELRRLVQEGIDSGPGREISIEEIKEEVRRRTGAKKAAS